MPLSEENKKRLEEAFKTVADEDYRSKLMEEAEKNPEFAGGWLRQSDYDRKMNELKSKHEKEIEVLESEKGKWKDFRVKLLEAEKSIKKQQAEIEAAQKEYEERMKNGEGDSDSNGTIEALRKELEEIKNRKVLTPEEFQAALTEKTAEVYDNMGGFLLNFTKLSRRQQNELGEDLDGQKLIDFMNENRIGNPEEAWEKMNREKIQKKFEEKIREEEREKAKEEFSRQNHPLSPEGVPETLGPLQKRLQERRKEQGDPRSELREGAAKAADELRKEGKVAPAF